MYAADGATKRQNYFRFLSFCYIYTPEYTCNNAVAMTAEIEIAIDDVTSYLNQPFRASRGPIPAIIGKEGNITIAEVIAELNPKARLLLQLRDPVSRLWSDFFYFAHVKMHAPVVPPQCMLESTVSIPIGSPPLLDRDKRGASSERGS